MDQMQLSRPPVITVQESHTEEVKAIGAHLDLLIKGTSLISGNAAFKKARELAAIVEALKPLGITEHDYTLRHVRIEVGSGVLTKFSSVNYQIRIACRDLEKLGDVLGAIASAKSAVLESIRWQFAEHPQERDRWLSTALAKAKARAQVMASALGVTIKGVYESTSRYFDETEEPLPSQGRYKMMAYRTSSLREEPEFEPGIKLTGSERRGVTVLVEFLIEPAFNGE